MSIMHTKLRSFNITNSKIYERFKQIQLERGKNASRRLNELIEKEVKDADPNSKELSAIRSKDAPDIIIPNPFLLDQAHALIEWREFLLTRTKKQHSELYNHLLALKLLTHDFEDYRLD
jgi:septin family protein